MWLLRRDICYTLVFWGLLLSPARCQAPAITGLSPYNVPTAGGEVVTFTGTNLVNVPWEISDECGTEWTDVTWVSSTELTAVSAEKIDQYGSGSGCNSRVSTNRTYGFSDITYSGTSISSISHLSFGYTLPNITGVVQDAKTGVYNITGTNFAAVADNIDFHYAGDSCDISVPYHCGVGVRLIQHSILQCSRDTNQKEKMLAGHLYDVDIAFPDVNGGIEKFSFVQPENNDALAGIPTSTTLFEGKSLTYTLTSVKPLAAIDPADPHQPTFRGIEVMVAATSDNPNYNCSVDHPMAYIEPPEPHPLPPTEVMITASGNNQIDEGTNAVVYSCTVTHTIMQAQDTSIVGKVQTLYISVLNDDPASMNLYTITPDSYLAPAATINYDDSYSVVFLPFYNLEGGTVAYGIKLETEPTAMVTVETVIVLKSNNGTQILDPPVLVADPPYLVFSPSNWSRHQRIMLHSIEDDVDHKLERFEVRHQIVSDDTVFRNKTNEAVLVVVDAADDDAAGIQLENPGALLSLIKGGVGKTIKITGLTSQPVQDVQVYVDIADGNVTSDIGNNPIPIVKEEWNTTVREVTFTALAGVTYESIDVKLRTVSDDLNYNKTDMLVLNVEAFPNVEPKTVIEQGPAKVIAMQKTIHFKFYSPDSAVNGFQWKFDTDDSYTSVPSCSLQNCSLIISETLAYDSYRLEVKAVTGGGLEDSTPASHSWTIAHCNGFSAAGKTQYAKIESDGALKCIECPHNIGADCTMLDDDWNDVIAVKGWWTSGTRDDTFYKCPLDNSNACLGGVHGASSSNSSTKSRCALGYNATVCAVCADGYYLSSDVCVECPPTRANATLQVSLWFTAYIGGFVAILLYQMRVKTTEHYWAVMKDEAAHKKRKKKLDRKTVKKIRVFVRFAMTTIKTFVTYLQILSVSHTVFDIPWSPAFLEFLRRLMIIQFDMLSISGMACVRPFTFYDSHKVMMFAPIVFAILVFIIFEIGLWRHKRHYGDRFTEGMRTSYGNHVIQFAMWITIILYPAISGRAIQYFNCSEKIDEKYYLVSDYRERCFEGEWMENLFFGVFGVVLYPLGIPAFFGWSLWSRRHRLDETDVAHRYGFLYEMYRRENYWWDVYEMLQKLFLTGAIVLIFPKQELQVVIAVLADLCFLMNLLIQKPHVAGPTRNLAMMGNMAITLTMYCGLVLRSVEGTTAYQSLFDVVLILMNGAVAVYAGYHVAPCRVCLIKSKAKHDEEKTERKSVVGGESDVDKKSFVVKTLAGKRLTEVVPARENVTVPKKHEFV